MFQAASSQHEAEKMLQAALSRARKRGKKGELQWGSCFLPQPIAALLFSGP